MGLESWFGGKKEEKKNTDSAGHVANPERMGELGAEDYDNVNMAKQLQHLNEQLRRAQEDADAGKDPEIPISELIERIETAKAQMPYGEESK